jgi:hypothetical protein
MITAAAITGRSSRIGPILRAGPRSLASTVASTTLLTIMASVSSDNMTCLLPVDGVSRTNPPSPDSPGGESEHGPASG